MKTLSNRILTDKEFREKIMEAALADAEAMSYNAAMNGDTSGTAYNIKQTVRDWKYGLEGTVPPLLQAYHDKLLQEEDPEWAEFVRLSKKFNKK